MRWLMLLEATRGRTLPRGVGRADRKLGAVSDQEFEGAIIVARESMGRVVKDALSLLDSSS
jgi:hypothetical protein